MTNEQFQAHMDTLISKLVLVRKIANKEYAQRHDRDADNVFANFERHANNLGLRREQVWAVYAAKHWDGIISHIAGNVAQREPVTGRIEDLIVYLMLLHGMQVPSLENTNAP